LAAIQAIPKSTTSRCGEPAQVGGERPHQDKTHAQKPTARGTT